MAYYEQKKMSIIPYFHEIEEFVLEETEYIVGEDGNEVFSYDHFQNGDILRLAERPLDYADENGKIHHATGFAIYDVNRHMWIDEYI